MHKNSRVLTKTPGKKGNIIDFIVVFLFIAVFAIIVLIAHTAYIKVNTAINQSTAISDAGKNASAKIGQVYTSFDNGFIIIVIGACVAILISSFLIYTHPIFFIINLLLIPILIIGTMIFSNMYEVASGNSMLVGAAAMSPVMNFTMTRLPYIVCAFALITMVILYAKENL